MSQPPLRRSTRHHTLSVSSGTRTSCNFSTKPRVETPLSFLLQTDHVKLHYIQICNADIKPSLSPSLSLLKKFDRTIIEVSK